MMTRKEMLMAMDDLTLDTTIKIQGTEHDRKRKLTDKQVTRLNELVSLGVTYDECAAIFKVHPQTAKAYADSTFREKQNARTRNFYARTHKDYHDYSVNTPSRIIQMRAAYKRDLVSKNIISA
jgi:hypothetical protein